MGDQTENRPLRWKRVAFWNLGCGQQVLFVAEGREVQYKVARAGTADKPSWSLYTRLPDSTEECRCVSSRLADTKSYAVSMEARAALGGHDA